MSISKEDTDSASTKKSDSDTASTKMTSPKEMISYLQYGDIIEVHSKKQDELDNKHFLVDYLDETKIRLIQIDTFNTYVFYITTDGEFVERDAIESIELLTRTKERGYARQKGLIVGKWLDLYFLGIDTPITGEITDLIEDQIEIMLYPSREPIYIDFAYRGLPEDLKIERFVIRGRPRDQEGPTSAPTESREIAGPREGGPTATMEYTADNEIIINTPDQEDIRYDPSYRDTLQLEYQDANEIVYGPEGEVTEHYEQRYEKVFSMDVQLESMLDEFLSNIPNAKRTERVMSNIQFLLERYRELHELFSNIDEETGEVLGIRKHGPKYKPLKEALTSKTGKALPAWLVPVAQIKRNFYMDHEEYDFHETETDRVPLDSSIMTIVNMNTNQMPEQEIMERKSMPSANINPYTWSLQNLAPYMSPFSAPNRQYYRPRPILFDVAVAEDHWEAVIDNQVFGNAHDFYITNTVKNIKESEKLVASFQNLQPTKHVTQRFTTGFSFLEQESASAAGGRRKIYVQNREFTPPDTISIGSWIMMPHEIVQFSRIYMPSLSIAKRAAYSDIYWMKRASLGRGDVNSTSHIESRVLDDLTKNIWREPVAATVPVNYILDSSIWRNREEQKEGQIPISDLYEQYVDTITPNTFELIEHVQPANGSTPPMSLTDQVALLEPFLVYMEDMTYTHVNRIRYFMKQSIQSFVKRFHESKEAKDEFIKRIQKWNQEMGEYVAYKNNMMKQILDHEKIYDLFRSYKIPALGWTDTNYVALPLSNSEILHHVILRDYMALFTILLKAVTSASIIPTEFLDLAKKDYETALDKLRAKGAAKGAIACRRYSLAKYYTSLSDLQKDNYQEDVFYDADLDDTPYELLNPYKKDMPEKANWQDLDNPKIADYLELLEKNLIHKHGIPATDSREYALRLLTKKRRVQVGEYAILDLTKIKHDLYRMSADAKGREELEKQVFDSQTQYYVYYQRKGNQWVKDTDVDEAAFMDLPSLVQDAFKRKKAKMNEMLCLTSDADCLKDGATGLCETTEEAENRLIISRRQLAQTELAKRIDMSMRDRMDQIEHEIEYLTHLLLTRERWRYGQMHKWNFAAKYLGKLYQEERAKGGPEGVGTTAPESQTETAKIRDIILAQPDFAKRQHDLVRFYQHFLREPMVETLGEDSHWLYSVESNHKILPHFLYDLALEYVTRGEEGYRNLLERIKQNQEISDDGHAIVDRNSGFTIAQIEWENEQLYDERGFKIQTGDVMEMDPMPGADDDAIATDAQNAQNVSLESEDMTTVKQIFDTYCRILEIAPKEQARGFSDFVIRVSLEYMEQNIMTPIDFNIQNEALIKKRGWNESKIQQQYKLYYQQYIVVLVTSMFLIGLQTINPAIKTKKSVPGCVKSFEGFPLTETMEDVTGIQYMACILNTVKSSYPPWIAVKSAKREMLQQSMIDQIEEILERRNDIHDLYVAQRAYRAEHPEEFVIPKRYQLEKWTSLLPPAIREIGVATHLAKDRMEVEWGKLNPKSVDTMRAQMLLYGYGVIESIHAIVRGKDVLLKTAMGIPFLQNACCSDKANQTALAYFMSEETGGTAGRNIEIFRKNIQEYESYSKLYDVVSKCTTHIFVDDNSLKRREVKHGNIEELIYSAFIHYCQFDRPDAPIPAHLTAICQTKPNEAHYRRNGGLLEKIQDLKDAGKKYQMEDLEELLRTVNRERTIRTDLRMSAPNSVQILTDFLSGSAEGAATAAPAPTPAPYLDELRPLLLNIMVKYDPQIALLENPKEEGEYHGLLNDLKNYLIPKNQEMQARILNYLSKYGNVNVRSKVYERLKRTLENLAEWTETKGHEEFYEMTRFLKNNMVFMCKIMPEILRNNMVLSDPETIQVPKHWNLAPKHNKRIQEIIAKYYEIFGPFFQHPESKTDQEENEAGAVGSGEQKKNETFLKILRMISGKLSDLVILSQHIPVTNPIEIGGEIWFRFMDRDTIRALFSYMWYAVLDQYIEFTETELQSVFLTKTARRGQVKASKNTIEETKLKQLVADLLLNFVSIVEDDKNRLDLSYSEIMKKVNRDKDVEKRSIMSRFEQASNSDLRYVNMEKRFKIGRWLMEDIHKYKKTRYEQEIAELLYQDLQADGIVGADAAESVSGALRGEPRDEEGGAEGADEDINTEELFGEYGEDQDQFDLDKDYVSDDEPLDYEGDF